MTKKRTHRHQFNVLTIINTLYDGDKEQICVFLECACKDDKPQNVITFWDSDLITAVQNYHGWLSSVAPALVSKDYRINDKRTELKKGGMSDDEI